MSLAKTFLVCSLIFFGLGSILLFTLPKGEIVLWINHNLQSNAMDVFFKYLTYLGDGVLLALLFIAAILYKYKLAIIVAISSIVQLVLVHINKQWIFSGLPRPKAYFSELGIDLNLIEGVNTHSYNSFPSGHTATAFSLSLIISLMVKRKGLELPFFLLATLIGVSRIYLLQHFFIDVYFGAMIGVVSVLIAIYVYDAFINHEKLNRGILTSKPKSLS